MSNRNFRRAGCALLLCLWAGALPTFAQAQATGPIAGGKVIRFVVPFGPGGAGDLSARILAQKMSESMKQSIVVDNKPGAGGVVASDTVAKAVPDGTTLLLMTNGAAVAAALFKSLPYDTLKDLQPLTTVGYFDMAVVTSAESPFKTMGEFLSYAQAHPGKLNVGTINVGSSQNLAAEMFRSKANIDVQIVPFNGTPAVITALRGGQIDAAVEIVGPMVTQIKANALRGLGIMGDKRAPDLPNVPTVAEGGVAGFSISAWNGLATTGRTPPAIVERLHREAANALASPDVRKKLADLYIDARSCSPEQMSRLVQSEIQRWGQVIEEAHIPKQ